MIWFDYLVIFILLCFILEGLIKGGVKQLSSLLGIIAGFFFSGRLSPYISPILKNLSTNETFLKFLPIISIAIAFILIYIAFMLLGAIFRFILRSLSLGIIDKFLGIIFGIVKGSLLVTLIYLAIVVTIPSMKPKLVRGKTYPIIQYTLMITQKLLPKNWQETFKNLENKIPEQLHKLKFKHMLNQFSH